MFEQLLRRPELHELIPFIRLWYGNASEFRWVDDHGRSHTIIQGDGGEQGDALMPALFCLALHPALEQLRAELPANCHLIAYLDDIYIVCDRDEVVDVLERTRNVLRQVCRINVNLGKLAAWSQTPTEAPPGLERFGDNIWKSALPLEQRGLKVLGTPLGTQEFVDRFCAERSEEKAQLLNLIPKLPSIQSAWLLLYFCAVPRINHLLRNICPTSVSQAAALHDLCILETFRSIFAIPASEDWDAGLHGINFEIWVQQARLPLRLGGCGLRDSRRISPAAYWASWADSIQDIVRRFPAVGNEILTNLARLQSRDSDEAHVGATCLVQAELAGKACTSAGFVSRSLWVDLAAGSRPPEVPQDDLALGEWQHGWQYHASDCAERRSLQLVMQALALPSFRINAACVGKSRIRSCMGRFSSTWLTACPTSTALCLKNAAMQCAMRRRLGIAAFFEGGDQHGHAAMTHNAQGRLNARHNWLLAAWRQVFIEAGGSVPDRNVERLLRDTHVPVPPDDYRRLDLIVPGLNVYHGLPLFCDLTIVSPITGTGAPRSGTSNTGGRLLEQAQTDNDQVYHEVISSGLGTLLCLGCEVYGRWSQQCVDLVPALARERSRGLHPRIRRGVALSLQNRWWGILGVALQNAVAHCIMNSSAGVDLVTTLSEPIAHTADLMAV